MRKLLMFLLPFLCSSVGFAEYDVKESMIFRINAIYVNEVFDGISDGGKEGDKGAGSTVELSFLLDEIDGIYRTIGVESGYIQSDLGSVSGNKASSFLVPIFVNYTVGSNFGDEFGFVWETGFGVGGVHADIELNNSPAESDNNFVFGGQVFGSVGYGLADSGCVLLGVRYILTDKGNFFPQDLEAEVINSFAIDLSLNYSF